MGGLMTMAALLLSVAGLAALSLAMDRHADALDGLLADTPQRRLATRALGTLWLSGALAASVMDLGPTVGVTVWIGGLGVAVFVVAGALTAYPRGVPGLATLCGASGLLAMALS